jgi:hypothetical protein
MILSALLFAACRRVFFLNSHLSRRLVAPKSVEGGSQASNKNAEESTSTYGR